MYKQVLSIPVYDMKIDAVRGSYDCLIITISKLIFIEVYNMHTFVFL